MPHRKSHIRRTRKNRTRRGGGKNNYASNTMTRSLERYRKNQQKMTLKKAAIAAGIGALALGGPALGYKAMSYGRPTANTTNFNNNSYMTIPKASKALLPVNDPACKTYRKWVTQLNAINNSKEFSNVPLDSSQIDRMALCTTPEQLRKNVSYAHKMYYNTHKRLHKPNNWNTKYVVTAPLKKDMELVENSYFQTL